MAEDQGAKERADARFKRAEVQAREGEAVRAENAARSRAVDANTARLKGLRLEKERADREATDVLSPKVVKVRPTKKPASS